MYDPYVVQGSRGTGMVCAGWVRHTPEMLEVSSLILPSAVLLNACLLVLRQCTTGPATVAMAPRHVFGEQCNVEVELGAIFMERSCSSTLSLCDLMSVLPAFTDPPGTLLNGQQRWSHWGT